MRVVYWNYFFKFLNWYFRLVWYFYFDGSEGWGGFVEVVYVVVTWGKLVWVIYVFVFGEVNFGVGWICFLYFELNGFDMCMRVFDCVCIFMCEYVCLYGGSWRWEYVGEGVLCWMLYILRMRDDKEFLLYLWMVAFLGF